jgi:hypothetical protein
MAIQEDLSTLTLGLTTKNILVRSFFSIFFLSISFWLYKGHKLTIMIAEINNIDEQSPEAEQTVTETRVRPVSSKILLPTPTAAKGEDSDSDGLPQAEQKEMNKEEDHEEEDEEEEEEEEEEEAVSTVSHEPSPAASIKDQTIEETSTPSYSSEKGSISSGDVSYPSLPNYDSAQDSSDFESGSGSDSERVSILSEATFYTDEGTPSETDLDELPEEEEEEQEYEAKSYFRADSNDEEPFVLDCNSPKVTGKCEAIVPWGGAKSRIIVSIGPARHRKWRVQPSKKCGYSIPRDLPEIKPRGRKSGFKATEVYGVAFNDDGKEKKGPEVIRGDNNLRIYVKIGWNDGTKTWERTADAKWLVEKYITADMSAGEYLYKAAVAFEKKADKFLDANEDWGYDDE